jgi:hypothetical protein
MNGSAWADSVGGEDALGLEAVEGEKDAISSEILRGLRSDTEQSGAISGMRSDGDQGSERNQPPVAVDGVGVHSRDDLIGRDAELHRRRQHLVGELRLALDSSNFVARIDRHILVDERSETCDRGLLSTANPTITLANAPTMPIKMSPTKPSRYVRSSRGPGSTIVFLFSTRDCTTPARPPAINRGIMSLDKLGSRYNHTPDNSTMARRIAPMSFIKELPSDRRTSTRMPRTF